MELSKGDLIHLLAIVGNCSSEYNDTYQLYLKLEKHGLEKYGDDFQEAVNKIEEVIADIPGFDYFEVEDKIKEIIS